jgi:hypothetical protein
MAAEYPIYIHKATGQKFKCIVAAITRTMEWYGFERVEGHKNLFSGFVMNNAWSIDEFGDWCLDDLPKNVVIEVLPSKLHGILPPIGFVKA